MLPYKFDISVYDKIRNPEFLEHIDGGKEKKFTKRKNNEVKIPYNPKLV
jgi:hypothetical protein